jgi:hypothetical protein
MTDPVTYAFGECPLSRNGLCESKGECPYGCDVEARKVEDVEAKIHLARLSSDPTYVLWRLMVCSAWATQFQKLESDFCIEKAKKDLELVKVHTTAWVWQEFKHHWPQFWEDFDGHDSITAILQWETKLYQLYSALSARS